MINYPIFERLSISDYGMFPGQQDAGLVIDFKPGLKLIVGANGLGKTTLVTILYRLLTGPYDIPGLQGRSELGNISLVPKRIAGSERRLFAGRVANGAENAVAEISFALGMKNVRLARSLKDLELITFEIDKVAQETEEVASFQKHIAELVGVWAFGDWILLLRHMVFYFEDRRSLVWDATAQRQLLRFLFLPAETAKKWAEDEREILTLDSTVRNLQFALTREGAQLLVEESLSKAGADVREELKVLQELQKADNEKAGELNDSTVDSEAAREKARLRYMKAEQERETRYRELERAKLIAVEARFPSTSDTARYIVAQILSEADCLVCGHHVPLFAKKLDERIRIQECVICGTDLSRDGAHIPVSGVADKRVRRAEAGLHQFEPELAVAESTLSEAEGNHGKLVDQLTQLNAEISQRSARIDALVRRLPPEEAELHRHREELSAMRGRLTTMRSKLTKLRNQFAAFVESESRLIVKKSGAVKQSFDAYAEGFLLEQCTLVWSPQRSQVGQTGESIEFPAYELEMTGTDFASPVRRSGPEQVSESQREFIDLAFRMSLMEVTGTGGVGTLVMDAPESSLDAVFTARAAAVLARFGKATKGNRLVITSNLVEGDLIPELLILASRPKERLSHLVNLFKLAEPTAAVKRLADEYRSVLASLLRRVKQSESKRRRGRR